MPISEDAELLAAIAIITSPFAGAAGGWVVRRFKPMAARIISPPVGSRVEPPFDLRGVVDRPLNREQLWFVSCNRDGAEKYWPQGRMLMVSNTEFRYPFRNEWVAPGDDITFLIALATKSGARKLNAIREEWDTKKAWPGIATLPKGVTPISDITMYDKTPMQAHTTTVGEVLT
jgi:hypothetical protein